jgi:transcriptional regulator GlxA family with amidase domain
MQHPSGGRAAVSGLKDAIWQDWAMHRVVVLALDGVVPFELGIAARIFGAATSPGDEPLYEVSTASLDGRPVRAHADFEIAVHHDASLLAVADTVVIPPAYPTEPAYPSGELPAPLSAALATIRPGTRLVAICTGAFVLAVAGLLSGRPATTHWRKTDELRRRFPDVAVNPDVLFIDDGDVLTSAGVAAGIDLCLHLVRKDHGSRTANKVARRCVVPPWRDGGQAQYIERPVPEPAGMGTAVTRAWAMDRLDQPLSIAGLAAHAGMSRRTFTRRFRAEVGVSPTQWLIAQRVDYARHLLETTDLTMDRIAERSGLGSGSSLRQHLRDRLGVSPQAYRRTFHRV